MRRTRFVLLVLILLGTSPGLNAQPSERIGDADGNGRFDRQDVDFLSGLLRQGAGRTPRPGALADVAHPCDGTLNAADLALLERAVRRNAGTGASTAPVSQCHGTEIGAPVPDHQAATAAVLSLDEIFAVIADEVPEFAGVYFDRGVPTIALTDPSPHILEDARRAVIARFGVERFGRDAVFQAAPVDFNFTTLHQARVSARSLLGSSGLLSLDVDERANRVTVGVADAAALPRVEEELVAAGIDPRFVELRIESYTPHAKYNELIRPIRAGRQVREPTWARCTLGAITDLGGVRGWITNSHCTPQFGVDNNRLISQPWDQVVGIEAFDPYFGPGLDYGECDGLPCRWSDSVFLSIDRRATSAIGVVDVENTTYLPNGVRYFTSVVENPLDGEEICHTGQKTGYGCGEVTATCCERAVDIEEWNWNYRLFCQYRSNLDTESGDSGSPVYQLKGTLEAAFFGIHHGGGTFGAEFSPVSGLLKDLGPIEVLRKNTPPEVRITNPTEGSTLGDGNTFTLQLEADFWDAEKGTDCPQCLVYWSSDVDGPLGTSPISEGTSSLTVSVWGAGNRTIRALAVDDGNKTGEDKVFVTTGNTPPQVSIDWPENSATLWPGIEYVFSGSSFDQESFGPLPCSALVWSTGSGQLGTGCHPTISFPAPGVYLVALTGTDSLSASATDYAWINVVDPPPNSPAVAEIFAPMPNGIYPSDQFVSFSVRGDDPDDQAPLTYRWVLQGPGLQPIELFATTAADGEDRSIKFVPDAYVSVPCGGRVLELRFEVTDQDGLTSVRTVPITAGKAC